MIYRTLQDKEVSLLGFGAMRLPQLEDGSVDEPQVEEMVRWAMDHGVNYFDTAWPYHSGQSERVMGRVLAKYPRESFYLADKFPGHQTSETYDPAAIFEEQLKRCGVEYFDFYLLHNVNENCLDVYKDPQWGILDYFREQKKNGRIKHLGFSTHGSLQLMEEFIDWCGGDMEFCQIQLNYLDWTLQDAGAKYEMLKSRGIPVIVMEPVRGGRLCNLSEAEMEKLQAFRPEASAADWGLRFLQDLDGVLTVLSGVSSFQQLKENVASFETGGLLLEEEKTALFEIAEGMKNSVPCTSCRYCCDGCPAGLDIPLLLSVANDMRFAPSVGVAQRLENLPAERKASACISCGKCVKICPQNIDIPAVLSELTDAIAKLPSWAEICRQRALEQKLD